MFFLISSNFQNSNFEIITITVTEILLILPLVLNKKKLKLKFEIPWHLHTTQKSTLLKTKEFHFSLVWVIEFCIISSCLGKVKVFNNSTLQPSRHSMFA